MPIYAIPHTHVFPPADHANEQGLLGVGGDLDPDRVLLAYRMGIFPWFDDEQPILWWSPDPRMVLFTRELRVQRSLRKRIKQDPYRLTMDTAFEAVIRRCASIPRPGQSGTWITEEMVASYVELHRRGHAHSVEAWQGDELVGGLYGIAIGRVFSGESMFATRPDASKIAFVQFVQQLGAWGFPLVDCQMHTPHLERFGARLIPRDDYLGRIRDLGRRRGTLGPWAFEI